MFNMYPGTGMGASGMGTGNVGNLDPQKLAMLLKQLMGGGGAPGGGMPSGAPMSAAPQMPQMGGGAPMGAPPPPPMPMPPQQAPNPFAGMAGAMGGAMPGMPPGQPQSMAGGMQSADIAKLLASLQRGQSGVSPAAAAGGPGLMSLIANLLQGRQGNGTPGAGMMAGLQQQADNNTAGGAPGL